MFDWLFGKRDGHLQAQPNPAHIPPVRNIRPEIAELVVHVNNPLNNWRAVRAEYDHRTIHWYWGDVNVDIIHSPYEPIAILARPSGVVSLNEVERKMLVAAFRARSDRIRAEQERKQLDALHAALNKDVAISP